MSAEHTMKTYSSKDVIGLLRQRQGSRSQRELAKEIGIGEAYLSDLLRGRRDAGPIVLEYLGLRTAVIPKSKTA